MHYNVLKSDCKYNSKKTYFVSKEDVIKVCNLLNTSNWRSQAIQSVCCRFFLL